LERVVAQGLTGNLVNFSSSNLVYSQSLQIFCLLMVKIFIQNSDNFLTLCILAYACIKETQSKCSVQSSADVKTV
jgi:low affinity Fe/Cu permease